MNVDQFFTSLCDCFPCEQYTLKKKKKYSYVYLDEILLIRIENKPPHNVYTGKYGQKVHTTLAGDCILFVHPLIFDSIAKIYSKKCILQSQEVENTSEDYITSLPEDLLKCICFYSCKSVRSLSLVSKKFLTLCNEFWKSHIEGFDKIEVSERAFWKKRYCGGPLLRCYKGMYSNTRETENVVCLTHDNTYDYYYITANGDLKSLDSLETFVENIVPYNKIVKRLLKVSSGTYAILFQDGECIVYSLLEKEIILKLKNIMCIACYSGDLITVNKNKMISYYTPTRKSVTILFETKLNFDFTDLHIQSDKICFINGRQIIFTFIISDLDEEVFEMINAQATDSIMRRDENNNFLHKKFGEHFPIIYQDFNPNYNTCDSTPIHEEFCYLIL